MTTHKKAVGRSVHLILSESGESLKKYRRRAIGIAIDLGYGYGIVSRIENASSQMEISRIMGEARRAL